MKKTLFEAVLLVAGFSVITRLLGFLFRIYLSWQLGAELLGVYQSAFSVFTVLIVLVSSGLPLAVSKISAQNGDVRSNKTVTAALLVGVIVSFVLVGVILVFRSIMYELFTDERCVNILIILLPALVSSAVYSVLRGAFWGEKDYLSVCATELIEQVFRIVLFVFILNLGLTALDGAMVAGWSMSLSCVLSTLIVLFVYFKKGKRFENPKTKFSSVLKSAVPVTGIRALSSLIHPVIALVFPAILVNSGYTTEQAMECYGVAMGMTFPLLFVPSTVIGALSFTLIPELSAAVAKNQMDVVRANVKSSCVITILVSMLFIPFFVGAGESIGKVLYNNSLSGIYLERACWIMIPLGLSNISSSVLNSFNLETKSFLSNILGGVILLIIVLLFSGSMGVDALIWGFGGCMLTTMLLNKYYIMKYTSVNLEITKPFLKMLFLVIPCVALTNLSMPLLWNLFPHILAVSLAGIIGGGGFLLLCWAFKLIDLTSVWVHIKFKSKSKIAHKN